MYVQYIYLFTATVAFFKKEELAALMELEETLVDPDPVPLFEDDDRNLLKMQEVEPPSNSLLPSGR
jgi:hypothetical protein